MQLLCCAETKTEKLWVRTSDLKKWSVGYCFPFQSFLLGCSCVLKEGPKNLFSKSETKKIPPRWRTLTRITLNTLNNESYKWMETRGIAAPYRNFSGTAYFGSCSSILRNHPSLLLCIWQSRDSTAALTGRLCRCGAFVLSTLNRLLRQLFLCIVERIDYEHSLFGLAHIVHAYDGRIVHECYGIGNRCCIKRFRCIAVHQLLQSFLPTQSG